MALDARGRGFWTRVLADPVGRALARAGVSANAVTVAGLVLTALAAVAVVAGRLTAAGLILVAGGLSDLFDGAVARARGSASVAGSFFDSVADRMSDGIILSAIAWHVRDEPLTFAVAAVALVTAQLTSYVRAKAESLGQSCRVGVVERPERAIALMAGLVFHWWFFVVVLWLLAAGGTVTVVQRIVHVVRKLDSVPAGGRT